jgi:hypothetical protein
MLDIPIHNPPIVKPAPHGSIDDTTILDLYVRTQKELMITYPAALAIKAELQTIRDTLFHADENEQQELRNRYSELKAKRTRMLAYVQYGDLFIAHMDEFFPQYHMRYEEIRQEHAAEDAVELAAYILGQVVQVQSDETQS